MGVIMRHSKGACGMAQDQRFTAGFRVFPGFSRLLICANATQKPESCHTAHPPSNKVTADSARAQDAVFGGEIRAVVVTSPLQQQHRV